AAGAAGARRARGWPRMTYPQADLAPHRRPARAWRATRTGIHLQSPGHCEAAGAAAFTWLTAPTPPGAGKCALPIGGSIPPPPIGEPARRACRRQRRDLITHPPACVLRPPPPLPLWGQGGVFDGLFFGVFYVNAL